jgi:hypothetical protein
MMTVKGLRINGSYRTHPAQLEEIGLLRPALYICNYRLYGSGELEKA